MAAVAPDGAPSAGQSPTPAPRRDRSGRSVERSAQLSLATTPAAPRRRRRRTSCAPWTRCAATSSARRSRAVPPAGSATFDLRVPAPQLQTALARLSKLATVRSRSETSLDVTGQVDAARDRVRRPAGRAPRRPAAARRRHDARRRPRTHGRACASSTRACARAEAARAALRRRTAYSTIALEVATERPQRRRRRRRRNVDAGRRRSRDALRCCRVAARRDARRARRPAARSPCWPRPAGASGRCVACAPAPQGPEPPTSLRGCDVRRGRRRPRVIRRPRAGEQARARTRRRPPPGRVAAAAAVRARRRAAATS